MATTARSGRASAIPKFRKLEPPVQEEFAGTTWETMRRIDDYVDVPTLQKAAAYFDRKSCRKDREATAGAA